MLRAYFDTNVYDAIDKGLVCPEEVRGVRNALASGQLTADLSFADVEELLGDWDKNQTAAIKRLKVARYLTGFESVLKQPSDLLKDVIAAYAAGGKTPLPTLPRKERRGVCAQLNKILNGGAISVATQIVADVRANKIAFKAR